VTKTYDRVNLVAATDGLVIQYEVTPARHGPGGTAP
jgi:hypothetical protein